MMETVSMEINSLLYTEEMTRVVQEIMQTMTITILCRQPWVYRDKQILYGRLYDIDKIINLYR